MRQEQSENAALKSDKERLTDEVDGLTVRVKELEEQNMNVERLMEDVDRLTGRVKELEEQLGKKDTEVSE